MKISDFSIRRPKFTIVVMLIFLLLGSVSFTRLPLQLFPDIEAPVAAVVTSYPGAGPQEVVTDVTEELERDLSTLSGLNNISSQSMEGSSLIILEFSWTTSIDEVENDIITTINQAQLPDDAGNPSFLKFDPSMFPSMQLAVSSDEEEVVDFQDEVFDLQRELSRVAGVADVSETGSLTEEFAVIINQEDAEEAGVAQQDIVSTIQSHHVVMPGGIIQDGENNITTRVLSELTSEEDLEELVVSMDPETGDDITLSDVAEVSLQTEDREVITRINQENAMQLSVMQEADANTTQVARDFNDRLDSLLDEERYEDLEVVTLYSEGDYIEDAINNVILALVGGGILAMVVLFAFLRNLKTPLIIGIAIPFSVIVTFALFFFTDITLNIMTLGGLALGIGMLVDNSIVVVENIYRHLSMRKTPKQAASDGTKEVAGAITASTLTTVSVFLPIVFITGLVGDLFAPLAITVAFSLFASLFVAITVVPMIASRILKTPKENIEEKRKNSRFIKGMESSVKWVLGKRAVILIITFILLAAGGWGLTTVGTDFLPDSDEGMFVIEVELDHGSPLERTQETVGEIENRLDEYDEVEYVLSITGGTSMQGPMASQSHEAEITVTLVPSNERGMTTIEFTEDIERDIENADDEAEIQIINMAQAGFGEPNTFSFTILDPNSDRLADFSEDLTAEIEDENFVRSVSNSLQETAPELQVLIDEEAAREEGMAPAQIASLVNNATTGQTAATIETEENDILQVNVRFDDELVSSIENFENFSFQNGEGEYITLSDVAEIEEGESPAVINRSDLTPGVDFDVVYTNDSSLGEVSAAVDDIIDDLGLADEAEYIIGGDMELMEDAFENMILAFALGLIFIFLVMSAQFESFKYPFVVMFTVPLFVIGVMLALTATQTPISVVAFIGIIVLAGIVVNNAIVLVDYINKKKEAGMDSYSAIIEGAKDRTRPILITALTTILGVTPLALGLGEGTEIQQPMGIVIIGGLASSTFLTLFVIPVIYSLLDSETRSMNKKYVTPDGEIVHARELRERKKAEPASDKEENPEDYEDLKALPASQDHKVEERKYEEREEFTKNEIVHILEELVRRSKQQSGSIDDIKEEMKDEIDEKDKERKSDEDSSEEDNK